MKLNFASAFFVIGNLVILCTASQGTLRETSIRHLKKESKSSKSNKSGKSGKSKKSKKSAERVITQWWVLFNRPSSCQGNVEGPIKCSIMDVMAEGNPGHATIMYATGGIPDKKGNLKLVSSLYKTGTCDLDLGDPEGIDHYLWGGPSALYDAATGAKGYCQPDEEIEVHAVFRDHGPPTEDKLLQLTRFTDPSCTQSGGPNLCTDAGAVAFPPMSTGEMMTNGIYGFPMFPPGCGEAGDCDPAVEMVQLKADIGNEATLIKTGDGIQMVASFRIPMA